MGKRIAHVLKSSKNSEYPSYFIFVDTETYYKKITPNEIEHTLKVGTAIYWRRRTDTPTDKVESITFTNLQMFHDFLCSRCYKKTKVYLISHNLDFDMTILNLYKYLREHGWTLKQFWEKTPSRYLKYTRDNMTLICLDNGNYFKGKLATIGESIGFPKLSVDFDTVSFDELTTYCMRDTEILFTLWKTWIKFCLDNDLGPFAQTLAGQAFSAFRHRFMKHDIFIHNTDEVLGLERMAYVGGRTEAFKLGHFNTGPYFNYDINSMYPYVMQQFQYPVKLKTHKGNVSLDFLRHYLKTYAIIAHVRVKTPVPVFPYKINNSTIYPVGEYTTYLCTPELQYALEHNYIKEIYEVALYETAPIFDKYVHFFYNKRQEFKKAGNEAFVYFVKIFLNCLYGKFGQKSTKWEQIGTADISRVKYYRVFDLPTGKWYSIREHNGIVEQSTEEEESRNSFPAIAAHVTAYARMYLWHIMEVAGRNNVYYTDTDCIFTNSTGKANLIAYSHETELGRLKQDKQADTLTIFGAKDYIFGIKRKIKGIRDNAEELRFSVYRQEKWNNYSSRIRKGNIDIYTVNLQVKRLKRIYTKGFVNEYGKIIPWILPKQRAEYIKKVEQALIPAHKPTELKVTSLA